MGKVSIHKSTFVVANERGGMCVGDSIGHSAHGVAVDGEEV